MSLKTPSRAVAEPRTHDGLFEFLHLNSRPGTPRSRGMTEIRGPYYTPMGKRYLQDVLETAGHWIDSLKFAGGSFAIIPPAVVGGRVDLLHGPDGALSTGGVLG